MSFKTVAVKAAKEAGKILLDNYGKIDSITKKGKNNFVTNVDIKAEKKIISVIRSKYPNHGFLCEESGCSKNGSDHVWVIDPLDGTHNYMQSIPMFGVSIALKHKGETVLGAIYLPLDKKLYVAEKGKGAFVNGSKIHVSKKRKLSDAFILFDSNIHKIWDIKTKVLTAINQKIFSLRSLGCAVWNRSLIANGYADAHIGFNSHEWDIAAGDLLIEEAGGAVYFFRLGDNMIHICGNKPLTNVLKKLTTDVLSQKSL